MPPMFGGPLGVHGVVWMPPMFGGPWVSMGCDGCLPHVWGPLGVPKVPWVSVRSHGCPHAWGLYWCHLGPMGVCEAPWVTPWLGVPRVPLMSPGCPIGWGPPP